MIIDKTFLREVAKEKKYTFISTGMSSYKMIDEAVNIFKEQGCEYELMHCVSQYPFEPQYASLNLINDMRQRYKCKIGYSGHEKSGIAISYGAVALGATSVERHITLDRSMWGTDQSASLSYTGMKNPADILSKAPLILGNGVKKISKEEKIMLQKFKYWK